MVLPTDQVQVICRRWSPRAHRIKDFLARSGIAYRFLDIGTDPDARRAVQESAVENPAFPLLLFSDGSYLIQPSDEEIAKKIGFSTEAESRSYDLVIIGGGPAGLTAAVNASSEGLRTIVIERDCPGGQSAASPRIDNFPGFPEGISGGELARRIVEQARGFGAEILAAREVANLRTRDGCHYVRLADGIEFRCRSVLIATGAAYRTLDVPGAEPLTGSGVYYGAASAEAFFYADQDVCLVGGGNSAGQAAMLLARFARQVTIITNKDSLAEGMSEYLVERIDATATIRVRPRRAVVEVLGEEALEAVRVKNLDTDEVETVPTRGLFVWIGAQPRTEWLGELLVRDNDGFILAGRDLLRGGERPRGWSPDREPLLLETSVPGIFVAGDVRSGSVKRVTSAIGEGAMAIQSVHQHLQEP